MESKIKPLVELGHKFLTKKISSDDFYLRLLDEIDAITIREDVEAVLEQLAAQLVK